MNYLQRFTGAALCAALGLMPSSSPAAETRRPDLNDILSARMIDGIRVSPSQDRVAFRVSSPKAIQNRTTIQWFAVSSTGKTKPQALGRPSEPIWMPMFAIIDDAMAEWLPDGESLAVLGEEGSTIGVHALSLRNADRLLTSSRADIRSFAIDPRGGNLDYVASDDHTLIAARQAEQERQGIRLTPAVIADGMRLTDNYQIGRRVTTVRHEDDPVPVEAFSGTGVKHRIALPLAYRRNGSTIKTAPVIVDFEHPSSPLIRLGTLPDGTTIDVERLDEPDQTFHIATVRIGATRADGRKIICSAAFCQGIYPKLRQAMLNAVTGEVVVLADLDRHGHPSLYGWNPATQQTRIIWKGTGALSSGAVSASKICPIALQVLICGLSGPTSPPELVSIDLGTGDVKILADPNAQLRALQYPRTYPVAWPGPNGMDVVGVFVEPYGTAAHNPLVITTNSCSGFLQGGTALVTPEFILAQRGIASLCMNTTTTGLIETVRSGAMAPVQIHKNVLAGLQAAIPEMERRFSIDPHRVGISGQSFSSISAAYAISHSDLFRAASIGTGTTLDPITYYTTAPTPSSYRRHTFKFLGLPQPDADPDHVWEEISPALNAGKIKAALLMQPPESEYLYTLQLYASIADANGIVDMFVYPRAGHMLGEYAAQQESRAGRSIAWFEFWLAGNRKPAGVAAADLVRWADLARKRTMAGAGADDARP